MSKPPGVEQTLRLLERLRSAARDLSSRQEALRETARKRLAAEQHRHGSAALEWQKRLAGEIERAEASFGEATATASARHLQRRGHIREAERRTRKAVLERIEAGEGRRKFELQRELLRVTRERDAGLAAADATLAEFKGQLAEDEAFLAGLELQAHRYFGVHGRGFQRLLAGAPTVVEEASQATPEALAEELRNLLSSLAAELSAFRRRPLTRLAHLWALWLVLILCPLPLIPILQYFGITGFTYRTALAVSGGLAVVGGVLHLLGRALARPAAVQIATNLGRARGHWQASHVRASEVHLAERARVDGVYNEATREATEAWDEVLEIAETQRATQPLAVEKKSARIAERNDRMQQAAVDRLSRQHAARLGELRNQSNAQHDALGSESERRRRDWTRQEEDAWQALMSEWQQESEEIGSALEAARSSELACAPGWRDMQWVDWRPPVQFVMGARFGRLDVDANVLAGLPKEEPSVELPVPARFSLPLLLTFPDAGSIVLEAGKAMRPWAHAVLNQVVLQLLAGSPPGRVAFTILDPVGLGQSFAGLMHLADDAEHLIHGRIWTQTTQIEERLGFLNDHMEKVIQMYLRNEYATIADYNEQAGNIAEKYHFLVVADFPNQFSELALQRFHSIATAGARCGVYLLVHWDSREPLPPQYPVDTLWKDCVRVTSRQDEVLLNGRKLPGVSVEVEAPPEPDVATAFIQRVAEVSVDSNRVEVPFSQVMPSREERWTMETAGEVRVPIGRTGATKFQYLALGKGTRQHALIAGKTGSGKSTLLHVLITNLALWCRPEEVEFYLVDFKKGVEFKCYAAHRLPHARVVAIESDREFGLSVLQRVDEELRRRGELFRAAGVQDIAGYRRSGAAEPMPRVLLVIDEFQELFVEEDRIGQGAALLLDRIVRQGRAFGIHAILGSQTLGGAYTVARSTLGQMVVRIALQCNEADAYLIMDDNNPAPRLLSRPGEGIYNDAAGAREGNSPFQTVWLPDDVRDARLSEVRTLADARPGVYAGPMIFEGDAPADVRENTALRAVLRARPDNVPVSTHLWLGAPNAIKGPTEAIFSRRSGSNLLIVGQREDAILGMLAIGLLTLDAQHPKGSARFFILDGSPPESRAGALLGGVAGRLTNETVVARSRDLESLLRRLVDEMRVGAEEQQETRLKGSTYLVVHDVQQFKRLRQEDEFGMGSVGEAVHPGELLKELISDGANSGIHVLATIDTYGNLTRFLGRKVLGDFGMRVLFQMSANDSASIIDQPNASRLGLHRALFHDEREGRLELFRPYEIPDPAWLDEVTKARQNSDRSHG